jgi:hypothetical protein
MHADFPRGPTRHLSRGILSPYFCRKMHFWRHNSPVRGVTLSHRGCALGVALARLLSRRGPRRPKACCDHGELARCKWTLSGRDVRRRVWVGEAIAITIASTIGGKNRTRMNVDLGGSGKKECFRSFSLLATLRDRRSRLYACHFLPAVLCSVPVHSFTPSYARGLFENNWPNSKSSRLF